MAISYAFDRDNNHIYAGDRMVEASGDSLTIYTVEEIEDVEHALVSFHNRPEHFGSQLGYTSGREVIDTRDFLLTEESLENRQTVTFSYIVSISHEIDVPVNINEATLKRLAFEQALSASDYLDDQPMTIEVDDPSGNVSQAPGWSVPSEFVNGWMDIDAAMS